MVGDHVGHVPKGENEDARGRGASCGASAARTTHHCREHRRLLGRGAEHVHSLCRKEWRFIGNSSGPPGGAGGTGRSPPHSVGGILYVPFVIVPNAGVPATVFADIVVLESTFEQIGPRSIWRQGPFSETPPGVHQVLGSTAEAPGLNSNVDGICLGIDLQLLLLPLSRNRSRL
jgi:hypothetical protein